MLHWKLLIKSVYRSTSFDKAFRKHVQSISKLYSQYHNDNGFTSSSKCNDTDFGKISRMANLISDIYLYLSS